MNSSCVDLFLSSFLEMPWAFLKKIPIYHIHFQSLVIPVQFFSSCWKRKIPCKMCWISCSNFPFKWANYTRLGVNQSLSAAFQDFRLTATDDWFAATWICRLQNRLSAESKVNPLLIPCLSCLFLPKMLNVAFLNGLPLDFMAVQPQ